MPHYEYKVVPAPNKGQKGKNVKGAEARFSHALQELMNGLSGYGWEYQRAETLPSLERVGLTGSTTEWRNVLVFRRLREGDIDDFAPELLPAPQVPVEADEPEEEVDAVEAKKAQIARDPKAYEGFGMGENGVEDPDDLSVGPALLSALAAKRKAPKPPATPQAKETAAPQTEIPAENTKTPKDKA